MRNIDLFKNEAELIKGIEDDCGSCSLVAAKTIKWLFKEYEQPKGFELPHWFVKGALVSIQDIHGIEIGNIESITRSGNSITAVLKGGKTSYLKRSDFNIGLVSPMKVMPLALEDARAYVGLNCTSPGGAIFKLDYIEVLFDHSYYHLRDDNNSEISIVDVSFTEWKAQNGKICGRYEVDEELERQGYSQISAYKLPVEN